MKCSCQITGLILENFSSDYIRNFASVDHCTTPSKFSTMQNSAGYKFVNLLNLFCFGRFHILKSCPLQFQFDLLEIKVKGGYVSRVSFIIQHRDTVKLA